MLIHTNGYINDIPKYFHHSITTHSYQKKKEEKKRVSTSKDGYKRLLSRWVVDTYNRFCDGVGVISFLHVHINSFSNMPSSPSHAFIFDVLLLRQTIFYTKHRTFERMHMRSHPNSCTILGL